ncbi:MAG: hypothetical protein HYX90_01175 [Chloroflexi bacterium]|nr:hypothetical protein [Chloroflexota bacterium]
MITAGDTKILSDILVPGHRSLYELFQRLLARYGPQHWWPADTPFEMMVGAVLTQSAAWTNVEKAIANLRSRGLLVPEGLRKAPLAELSGLVRPSGYFNVKARKLKSLAAWLALRHDDIPALGRADTANLRAELLSVWGIGEETADSILLYACNKPVFVIDAYTKRIMGRLGITPLEDDYHGWQSLFMEALPPDVPLFNEYHALLVQHGKEACNKVPRCLNCCLRDGCQEASASGAGAAADPPH